MGRRAGRTAVIRGGGGIGGATCGRFAREGARVDLACPGVTETPLFEGRLLGAGNPGKLRDAFRRSIPPGLIGQADDLPGAIQFFASDDAAFVTGQVLSVSGGRTMAG